MPPTDPTTISYNTAHRQLPAHLRDIQTTMVRSYVDAHGQTATWKPPDCTWAVFRSHTSGAIRGFLSCGSWDCPDCGVSKKMRLEQNAKFTFDGEPCTFMTLTLSEHRDDTEITHDFARLRASLYKPHITNRKKLNTYNSMKPGAVRRAYLAEHGTRYFNKSAGQKYFWVKEFTPPSHEYSKWDHSAGCRVTTQTLGYRRHMHLITNFRVPARLLSNLWRKATNGTSWVCHQTDDHGDLRVSYMIKYITKSCSDVQEQATDPAFRYFNRHERRYGCSCKPDSRKAIFKLSNDPPLEATCWVQPLAMDPERIQILSVPNAFRDRKRLDMLAAVEKSSQPPDILTDDFMDEGANVCGLIDWKEIYDRELDEIFGGDIKAYRAHYRSDKP